MPRKEVQESSMPGGRALLTIVAAISFFLYQYLIIHTAVTMDGACLYTFWLPYKDQWFSPYWITVALVVALVLWSLMGLSVHLKSGRMAKWHIAYYSIAAAVLCVWLYNLSALWSAMDYERGLVTTEEYHAGMLRQDPDHQCKGI